MGFEAPKMPASGEIAETEKIPANPDINELENEKAALEKWHQDETEKCYDNLEKRLAGAEKAYSNPQEVKDKKNEITTRFLAEKDVMEQEYDKRKTELTER